LAKTDGNAVPAVNRNNHQRKVRQFLFTELFARLIARSGAINFLANGDVQEIASFGTGKPVFLHDQLSRITQPVFTQSAAHFRGNAFPRDKQWHKRKLHGQYPFSIFFSKEGNGRAKSSLWKNNGK
jgi:hypothetical protein